MYCASPKYQIPLDFKWFVQNITLEDEEIDCCSSEVEYLDLLNDIRVDLHFA